MFLGYPGIGFDTDLLGSVPVPERCRAVLTLLAQFPMASVAELSNVTGRWPSGYYSLLWELKDAGFVDLDVFGGFYQRAERWWFTKEGIQKLGRSPAVMWHEDWFRSRLLERLPVVESLYRAAGSMPDLGELRFFQWFHQLAWDAAAWYEKGWVAFFWAGIWQDEKWLSKIFSEIGDDLSGNSVQGTRAYPCRFCFVVPDLWQRELVFRAARRHSLSSMVSVYCIDDESWAGVALGSPGEARGWVAQFLGSRDMGNWGWEERAAASPYRELGGPVFRRLFLSLAEWPGMSLTLARRLLGESQSSRRAYRFLLLLVEGGYFDRVKMGRLYRYRATAKGLGLLSSWDRVAVARQPAGVKRAIEGLERPDWHSHERRLMDLMGKFADMGLPIASGWRSWEHLGGGGGIAPDGLVRLRNSPYGSGWHYVEYERSAIGDYRVRMKLRGYGEKKRQDNWPVLVVCRNDRAEGVFCKVGADRVDGSPTIPMLTATEERLAAAARGRMAFTDVWRNYGEAVRIG